MGCKILGIGGYLPNQIITNKSLESQVQTSDEWIRSRTGISKRHIASENEYTSELAVKAALLALEDAKLAPNDIDLIMVATTTADNSFPSVATKVQNAIKSKAAAFDLQAVCSGFVYGLYLCESILKSKKSKNILLIGAEKMSNIVDWSDRSTCILFGDGAGAIVISYDELSSSDIIDSMIWADGSLYSILHSDGGIGMNKSTGLLRMSGQEVYKKAIEMMSFSVKAILEKNKVDISEIDYFIPHQANSRIIDAVASNLQIEPGKIVKTIDKHANCSAASIPLALYELKLTNSLEKGKLMVLSSFGAGATWASALIRI